MNDKMIALGDKRILISSIQEYGIATKDIYYTKFYERIRVRGFMFDSYKFEWHGEKERIGEHLTRSDKIFVPFRDKDDGKRYCDLAKKVKHQHIIVEKERCMYVKTTQGDTLVYYETEAPFDITEKCKELDEIFNKD